MFEVFSIFNIQVMLKKGNKQNKGVGTQALPAWRAVSRAIQAGEKEGQGRDEWQLLCVCSGLGCGPSRARLAASDPPMAGSLGDRGGARAAAIYLVEVEIVLRLLQPEFLALFLADTQQQIIKHMVIPVGDQQGESVPGQANSTGKGG